MRLQIICQGLLFAFIATAVAHEVDEDVSNFLDPYDYNDHNRQKRTIVASRQVRNKKREATALMRRQYNIQHRKSFKKTIYVEENDLQQINRQGEHSQAHRHSEHEESDENEPDEEEPEERKHDEHDKRNSEDGEWGRHSDRNEGHREDGEDGRHSDEADSRREEEGAHRHGEHADDDDDGIED